MKPSLHSYLCHVCSKNSAFVTRDHMYAQFSPSPQSRWGRPYGYEGFVAKCRFAFSICNIIGDGSLVVLICPDRLKFWGNTTRKYRLSGFIALINTWFLDNECGAKFTVENPMTLGPQPLQTAKVRARYRAYAFCCGLMKIRLVYHLKSLWKFRRKTFGQSSTWSHGRFPANSQITWYSSKDVTVKSPVEDVVMLEW